MKFFSTERANALIPVLSPLIEDLWLRRRELAIAQLERDPALRGKRERGADRARVEEQDGALAKQRREITRLIEAIEAHGCIVKDLDLGLIDFPSLRHEQPIFLCWKAGEHAVTHWHAVSETFADRKPIG